MDVYFKKMHKDSIIPTFGHDDPTNAGLDFYARLDKPVWIWPLCSKTIGTGIAWEPGELIAGTERVGIKTERIIPYLGFKPAMLVRGRSGVTKRGLSVSGGTIDASYRGEIMLHARCFRLLPWIIKPGMRIGQGIIILLPDVSPVETGTLKETARGSKGFGSSGD